MNLIKLHNVAVARLEFKLTVLYNFFFLFSNFTELAADGKFASESCVRSKSAGQFSKAPDRLQLGKLYQGKVRAQKVHCTRMGPSGFAQGII